MTHNLPKPQQLCDSQFLNKTHDMSLWVRRNLVGIAPMTNHVSSKCFGRVIHGACSTESASNLP